MNTHCRMLDPASQASREHGRQQREDLHPENLVIFSNSYLFLRISIHNEI